MKKIFTKLKKISFSLKSIGKIRQDGKYMKKENSKTWSEEAKDTLINQSHESLWNVACGGYKDQNKKL